MYTKYKKTTHFLLCFIFTIFISKATEKPNIIFLLGDDINQDSWGTYGNPDCKTPNIDKLAKEGMKFNRAYCSMAMCAPFRHELYSGRTPWRTQTMYNHSGATPDTLSWPHYLEPFGYRVGLMGKKHVVPGGCYPFESLNKDIDNKKPTNADFIKRTEKFIDDCAKSNAPFCAVIASSDAHIPWTQGDPSLYNAQELNVPPYWLDTPELREEMVQYYAEVTNFDSLVGGVRALLEKKGLWHNTIFFVCGEQGTRLPLAKWTCYDNGLRTGLIVHWNGVIKPGSNINELVMTNDIAPTLVDIAGGKYQQGEFDGFSLLPTLKGEKQVLREYVYGAFTNAGIAGSNGTVFPIRSIRNKDFALLFNANYKSRTVNAGVGSALKMVENPSFSPKKHNVTTSWIELSRKDPSAKSIADKLHYRPEYELYHLTKDPHELKNVIDNPEYLKIADQLKQALKNKLNDLGDADPIETEKAIIAKKENKQKKKK